MIATFPTLPNAAVEPEEQTKENPTPKSPAAESNHVLHTFPTLEGPATPLEKDDRQLALRQRYVLIRKVTTEAAGPDLKFDQLVKSLLSEWYQVRPCCSLIWISLDPPLSLAILCMSNGAGAMTQCTLGELPC